MTRRSHNALGNFSEPKKGVVHNSKRMWTTTWLTTRRSKLFTAHRKSQNPDSNRFSVLGNAYANDKPTVRTVGILRYNAQWTEILVLGWRCQWKTKYSQPDLLLAHYRRLFKFRRLYLSENRHLRIVACFRQAFLWLSSARPSPLCGLSPTLSA